MLRLLSSQVCSSECGACDGGPAEFAEVPRRVGSRERNDDVNKAARGQRNENNIMNTRGMVETAEISLV